MSAAEQVGASPDLVSAIMSFLGCKERVQLTGVSKFWLCEALGTIAPGKLENVSPAQLMQLVAWAGPSLHRLDLSQIEVNQLEIKQRGRPHPTKALISALRQSSSLAELTLWGPTEITPLATRAPWGDADALIDRAGLACLLHSCPRLASARCCFLATSAREAASMLAAVPGHHLVVLSSAVPLANSGPDELDSLSDLVSSPRCCGLRLLQHDPRNIDPARAAVEANLPAELLAYFQETTAENRFDDGVSFLALPPTAEAPRRFASALASSVALKELSLPEAKISDGTACALGAALASRRGQPPLSLLDLEYCTLSGTGDRRGPLHSAA